MTSRSFYAVGPRYALGASFVANTGPFSLFFVVGVGPLFFPSTFAKKRKKVSYLRPHCTSCQDKIDQSTDLKQGQKKKKWKEAQALNCAASLRAPERSSTTAPPISSLIQARSSKKPVFTWENVSHWQVSTWLRKRRRGRNFSLNFSLTLFLLLTLGAPTKPIMHVPGLFNLLRQVNHLKTALSVWKTEKEKKKKIQPFKVRRTHLRL